MTFFHGLHESYVECSFVVDFKAMLLPSLVLISHWVAVSDVLVHNPGSIEELISAMWFLS